MVVEIQGRQSVELPFSVGNTTSFIPELRLPVLLFAASVGLEVSACDSQSKCHSSFHRQVIPKCPLTGSVLCLDCHSVLDLLSCSAVPRERE